MDHPVLGLFAAELKLARAAAGMSQEQLAGQIAYSPSLVALVETGRRVATADFARRCDDALGTGGLFARMQPVMALGAFPSWFRPYVELEAAATGLRSWQPLVVDGLLQTESYARAVLRAARPTDDEEQIEQLVSARMERQSILLRDDAPVLWVILDEGVLHRSVGGAGVMREQLDHLVEAARRPKVVLQVVPSSAGAHAGLLGPFVIVSLNATPDVVYLDTALTGQIVERQAEVTALTMLYDTLRAEALSPKASADFVEKVRQEWT
jgi:transcriptional regulator with XRE-family HTH domain